jgi:hypothetical protein
LKLTHYRFVTRAPATPGWRLKRNNLQAGDLLEVTVVACGDGVSALQRASADEQVIEGDGNALL